ncbi:MAG: hypothetical protein HZB16_17175 [Armatimonadetes bacterium]|nr:hypothetical protein [Armatimonadota bacterium]
MVRRSLGLLVLLSTAWSARALSPMMAYEPLAADTAKTGARRTYESRSSVLPERVVQWQSQFFSSLDLPDGSRQVTLKTSATGSVVWPPARNEVYVLDPRGLYTPSSATDPPDPTEYGPTALLAAQPELQRLDHVWRFEGRRVVPFSFTVLMLTARNMDPVAMSARYHVLSIGPLETPTETFPSAVQVAGVERVALNLGELLNDDVLVRCRRWYVRGIGLVQEALEFPSYPSLGRLTTVLTSHPGLSPEPLEVKAN